MSLATIGATGEAPAWPPRKPAVKCTDEDHRTTRADRRYELLDLAAVDKACSPEPTTPADRRYELLDADLIGARTLRGEFRHNALAGRLSTLGLRVRVDDDGARRHNALAGRLSTLGGGGGLLLIAPTRHNALAGRLSTLAVAVEAHEDNPVGWLRDDPQRRKALRLVVALARGFAAHYDRLLPTADRVHDPTQEPSRSAAATSRCLEPRSGSATPFRCCAMRSPTAAPASG